MQHAHSCYRSKKKHVEVEEERSTAVNCWCFPSQDRPLLQVCTCTYDLYECMCALLYMTCSCTIVLMSCIGSWEGQTGGCQKELACEGCDACTCAETCGVTGADAAPTNRADGYEKERDCQHRLTWINVTSFVYTNDIHQCLYKYMVYLHIMLQLVWVAQVYGAIAGTNVEIINAQRIKILS